MRINRKYKVIRLDETQFKDNSLKGLNIVITGTLKYFSRTDIKKAIISLGGQVKGSVSKNTSFLILGEDTAGSKLDRAKELDIKILSEEDFLDIILDE